MHRPIEKQERVSRESIIQTLEEARQILVAGKKLIPESLSPEQGDKVQSIIQAYLQKLTVETQDFALLQEIAGKLVSQKFTELMVSALNGDYGKEVQEEMNALVETEHYSEKVEKIDEVLGNIKRNYSALFLGEESLEERDLAAREEAIESLKDDASIIQLKESITQLQQSLKPAESGKKELEKAKEGKEKTIATLERERVSIRKRIVELQLQLETVETALEDKNEELSVVIERINENEENTEQTRERIQTGENILEEHEQKIRESEDDLELRKKSLEDGKQRAMELTTQALQIIKQSIEDETSDSKVEEEISSEEKLQQTEEFRDTEQPVQVSVGEAFEAVEEIEAVEEAQHALDIIEGALAEIEVDKDPEELSEEIISEKYSQNEFVNDALIELAQANMALALEVINFYEKCFDLHNKRQISITMLAEIENCAFHFCEAATNPSFKSFIENVKATQAYNASSNGTRNTFRALVNEWEKRLRIAHTDYFEGQELIENKKVLLIIGSRLQKLVTQFTGILENLGASVETTIDAHGKGHKYDIIVTCAIGAGVTYEGIAKNEAKDNKIPHITIQRGTNSPTIIRDLLVERLTAFEASN